MKKVFVLILALCMVFAMAACASESGGTESSGQQNESSSTPTASNSVDPGASEDHSQTSPTDGNQTDVPSHDESYDTASPDNSDTASPDVPDQPSEEQTGKHILVAYFSATNNTEGVAQKLADGLDADLYEITPEQPYTDADLDYGNSGSRSSVEMNDPSARPAISGTVSNMEQYDVVLIGYPIWWGEAPKILYSFLESYDFTGKTIVPFCTSSSSGIGSSAENLHNSASGATWLNGSRFASSTSKGQIEDWIHSLNG